MKMWRENTGFFSFRGVESELKDITVSCDFYSKSKTVVWTQEWTSYSYLPMHQELELEVSGWYRGKGAAASYDCKVKDFIPERIR